MNTPRAILGFRQPPCASISDLLGYLYIWLGKRVVGNASQTLLLLRLCYCTNQDLSTIRFNCLGQGLGHVGYKVYQTVR